MSREEIRRVIQRFVDEPWNEGKLEVIDELCAPNYKLLGVQSRADLKKAVADARARSPHLEATVSDIIVEGDAAAYGWTMRYTEEGKAKAVDGITILRFAGRQIVEDRFVAMERPAGNA